MAVTFFGHTPDSTGMNELICRDPGFKDKCTQTILPNLSTIVTDLVMGEESAAICNKLSLCLAPNSNDVSSIMEEIPQIKCSSCQAVVHTLKVSLQGNVSDAKIQQGLQNLCSITPLKGTCSKLKAMFTEHTLDVRNEVYKICEIANYCNPIPDSTAHCRPNIEQLTTPNLHRSLPMFTNEFGTPAPIFGIDAGCQACQWFASAIEAYLSQESTEEELARVLQELCTALPPEYAKVCQNFVSVYLTEALVYLLDRVTPPFICSKLLQCE